MLPSKPTAFSVFYVLIVNNSEIQFDITLSYKQHYIREVFAFFKIAEKSASASTCQNVDC